MRQIIVSLTSFPAAIPFATQAIQSILDGSVFPDKIVLYLTASQFPNNEIPESLQVLKEGNPSFEVRFYEENIRSYTKLIPALRDFPDDIIVTVDDDMQYGKHLLRRLLRLHKRYPEAIIGHRVRHLKLNAPYLKSKRYMNTRFLTKSLRPRFGNLQTGIGGVLYPPHSLKPEMLDSRLFMEIAPTTDDIWFWAAAVANGTRIAPVPFGDWNPRELDKPLGISLKQTNISSNRDVNREVIETLLERYPIIKQRVEDEK
ncbi:glycosyltransferase [Bacteroidales bacterium OttesenSCG-928-J19]|nr:glycosyltransferase [Bacteroidales bacterium OttesenSCG-928-J19]